MKKARLAASVGADIADFVEKFAAREGVSKSAVVERALTAYRKDLCSWCRGTGRKGFGEVDPKMTTMPNHSGPMTMVAVCYLCSGTGFRRDREKKSA